MLPTCALWLFTFALALVLGNPWTIRAADQTILAIEAREDFEWFGKLGFPDVTGRPFVRVATGQWTQLGNEPAKNRYVLIAALDDPAFSRSVGFHRNFHFSPPVLTVGDCALAILERITNKTFFRPRSSSSYLSNSGQALQIKKTAEAWWADVQKRR